MCVCADVCVCECVSDGLRSGLAAAKPGAGALDPGRGARAKAEGRSTGAGALDSLLAARGWARCADSCAEVAPGKYYDTTMQTRYYGSAR
jgi:hypothetical protein